MEDQDPLKHLRALAKDETSVPFELTEFQRAVLLKARQMRTCPPHVAFRFIAARLDDLQGKYVLADDHCKSGTWYRWMQNLETSSPLATQR